MAMSDRTSICGIQGLPVWKVVFCGISVVAGFTCARAANDAVAIKPKK